MILRHQISKMRGSGIVIHKGAALHVDRAARSLFVIQKLARLRGGSEEATDYKYAHDFGEEHYVPQAYLPEGRVYYHPTTNGMELRITERMNYLRSLQSDKQ